MLLVSVFAAAAFAEEADSVKYFKGWKKSFSVDLTATQASYSDSWTGGEAGSFNWVSNGNGVFSKWLAPWFRTKNTLKLSFGQTITQDEESKEWSKPQKSSDKIDLESVGLVDIHAWVEPFIAGRFESQFLDASNEAHKEYLDPMLLTLSAGAAKSLYTTEKNEVLTRLGLAVKHYRDKVYDEVAMSTSTATKTDAGIESNTDVKISLKDNMDYMGKLTLYKAFAITDKDKQPNDDWKAIDVNWENSITASISKYVKVILYTQLLYDKQISKKGRMKETLSLGLAYTLF